MDEVYAECRCGNRIDARMKGHPNIFCPHKQSHCGHQGKYIFSAFRTRQHIALDPIKRITEPHIVKEQDGGSQYDQAQHTGNFQLSCQPLIPILTDICTDHIHISKHKCRIPIAAPCPSKHGRNNIEIHGQNQYDTAQGPPTDMKNKPIQQGEHDVQDEVRSGKPIQRCKGEKRLQDAVRSELIHTKHKNRKSKNNKAPKIGARKEFT